MKDQNGEQFSTKDQDNDSDFAKGRDCAGLRGGGWWYRACGASNLNGKYAGENEDPGQGGIRWRDLEPATYSFKETKMMIKRN